MSLAWTLGDLVSRATQALGNIGPNVISSSDASHYANVALQEVWTAMPFDQQQQIAISSTTSGSNRITLPTDFLELIALSNLSMTPPQVLHPLNVELVDSYTTNLGTPVNYMQYSSWLELVPSPDSSYSLQMRYRSLPSTMTALTDIPSIATRYRQAVFYKTKALLADNVLFDATKAAKASAEYDAYMVAQPSDNALKMREQHYIGCSIPSWNRPVRQSRATIVW